MLCNDAGVRVVSNMATQAQYVGHFLSVETLQRRIAYGGKKGKKAARRVRRASRHWCIDRDTCREYFSRLPKRRNVLQLALWPSPVSE